MAALRDAELEHVRVGRDPLPDLSAVDGLVVFGGAESVTEIDRHPYLLDEMALLHEAVAQDVPVLGICLGAQVLAHALGGRVRRLPRRAVRWVATELLDRGGLGCAAFRLGSGWGFQFHADVDGATLDGWYQRYGDWLVEAGVEPAAARDADRQHLPGQSATAEAIFGGFVRRARAARSRAPR
jgi:GMP synthase (glutamine-hydrolysing)